VQVSLHNRQKKYRLPLNKLRRQTAIACRLLGRRWPRHLEELEVTLLTPAASARIHRDFFQDSAPTDVMTFEHGEILVCPHVADRQRLLAESDGLSLEHEVLTYILHGMLHLCGWGDHTSPGFKSMRREQTRLRQKVLKEESLRRSHE
jgi:probable rRNA maturation factor